MHTTSKTIVLVGQEGLLSSSVELFLKAKKGWNVFNIANDGDLSVLVHEIGKAHPDVVIVHQGDQDCNLELPTLLLHDQPELKVIMINPNNNLMEVFSKQNILVQSASELILVVENSHPKQTGELKEIKPFVQKGAEVN